MLRLIRTLLSATIRQFIPWYFFMVPGAIVQTYVRYARALAQVFSFVFLFKTLFSPWKNILDQYPAKGFDLSLIAQAFFLNLTTRSIGAVIRFATIVSGIVVQVVALGVFVTCMAFWFTLPLLPVLAFSPAFVAQ